MKILAPFPEIRTLSREEEMRLAKSKNEESRNTLILHYMREAFVYARRCCRQQIPEDELLSLCYASLQRAMKNYDSDRTSFFNYARVFLRGDIAQFWRDKDTVRNSSKYEDKDAAYNYPVRKIMGTENPDLEISVEPETDLIMMKERLQLVLPIVASKLNDHEKMILDLFYNGGFAFRKIGAMLGVSRSAAQITAARALKKIRKELMRKRRLYNE